MYLPRSGRLRFHASGTGGFLIFTRDVPVPGATKFNFAFDIGGGLQFGVASNWALTLGYKFHHLSNASTTGVNPGLDANVFYAGFSFFR